MKKLLALTLIAMGFSIQSRASHVMGADITYECLGNNQYVFTVTIYRDCDGSSMGTTTSLDFTSPSCGQTFSVTLPQVGVQQEVSQVCTPQLPNTTCGTGALPGTEMYIYSDTITMPAQCTDWTYSWNLCCRNGNITNLQTPTTYDLYTEGTLDNTIGCNDSPQFSSLPTPYICVGQPYCYNHGTWDPDGDSLAFSLVQPLDAAGVPIPWAAGYSTAAPVQSSTGFNFDPLTGEMCFTPSITQTCVVSVLVEEWRNGVLIATSTRELQIVVYNCTNQQPSDIGVGILNMTGGPTANQTGVYDATVCPGDQICWDMLFGDPDGHNVTVTDNVTQAIPGATFNAPLNGTNSTVAANFCWTPTALDTGLHVFTVGVEDDGCPILGGNYYTFTIYVWDQTFAGPDQFYCPGGVQPQLSTVGGTTFTWTSISGDPIIVGTNFSCNPCSAPIATPSQTTTYVVTSDLSASCGNTDTVTVFVVPDFPLTMSPNVQICLNEITQLTANTPSAAQGPYTYSWSPTTGLDDPNVQSPNASPQVTTTYTVTVTSASGCTITDQVTVTVSGIGPTVYLTDTSICPTDCIQLNPVIAIEPGFCGPAGPGCTGNLVTAQVGNGTLSSSTYSPLFSGTIYEDFKAQYLFTAAELQAAGVVPGKITQVAFNVTVKNSTAPYQNFRVSMGCTNASCLTVASGWQPTTPVFGPANYTSVLGMNTIILTTPFDWDGTSNLVIETCFDYPDNTFAGGYDNVEYTSGLSCDMYMREYESVNGFSGCNLAPAFDYNARANWTFTVCQTPPTNPTFTWSPAAGLSATNIQNPTACPTASTTYQVDVVDQASGCTGSGTITVTIDSTNYVTASPDVTICGGSTQLDAIFTGPQPPPSIPCGFGSACTQPSNVFTVGNGTLSSSTYAPVYSSSTYPDSRHQFLVLASELQAAGIPSGTFTTIAWNFTTANSVNPYQNFRIGMGCTNATCLTVAGGWLPTTPVYGPVNMSPVIGWNTYTLTTSFDWDGVSNIVIETCFNNPNNQTAGGIDNVQYMSGFPCDRTMREYENLNGANGCTLPPVFDYAALPNFQFTVCEPDPLALTYSWSPATGLSDPNIQNPVASPATTTQYVVTVTGGYCPAYDTVNVIIAPLSPPTVNFTDLTCNGANDGTISITPVGGTAPYTYSIDNGANFQGSANFTGLAPGTYDIVVEDANGCQSTAQVTISEPVALSVTVAPVDESCDGADDGTAVATPAGGTAPYTYNWAPAPGGGQGTNSATGMPDGAYTVTVTDANNCTANANFNINIGPAVTGNFTYNGNQCMSTQSFDFTDLSVNATSWDWDFGPNATPTTSTAQNPTGVTFNAPGVYPIQLTAANGPCEHIVIINVEVYPEPTVTASGTNVLCNGACDGSVTATAAGTSGYTYSWDQTLGAGQTHNNLCPNTYTVTVTDINGCQATDSYTVTEPAVITSSIAGTDVSCNGANDGTATVTAGGGTAPLTYNWAPAPGGGQGTNAATGLTGGTTYTVTITDANGCTATETFTPNEPAAIVVTATGTDANCGASDGTLTVTNTTGGSGNYVSTDWVDDATSLPVGNPNAVPAGSYTVTVTDDQGCTGTATVAISNLAGPVLSITAQTNASCSMVCDGTASVSVAGGSAPYTYTWNPAPGTGQGTNTVTGLCGGTNYSVTVDDGGGCSDVINILIGTDPDPTIAIVVDQDAQCNSVCDGQATATVTGGTAPITYTWGNGENTQQAVALCAGNTTLDITDANGCTAASSVTINEPTAATLTIAGTDATCNGACDGSADATIGGGTAPYTTTWQHGPTSEDLLGVLCQGTYTLDVTDANGCTVSASVTINEPAAITSSIAGTDVTCNGANDGTATVTAGGGTGILSYVWAPAPGGGQGTNAATGLVGGTAYTVTITDANGCTATETFTPNEPAALAINTTTVNSNCGQADGSATATASGGTAAYTYEWYDDPGLTNNIASGTNLNNVAAGTYYVEVTDANGCVNSVSVNIVDNSAGTLTETHIDAACNGSFDGSIDLTVTGGTAPFTYAWVGPNGFTDNVEDITGLEAGSYDVTVTDGVGCIMTLTIVVNEPTAVSVTATGVDASCNGFTDGSVDATGTGGTAPITYEWYDNPALTNNVGSGTPLGGLAAGTYYVEATDANGCTASTSITISEPSPIVPVLAAVDANCGQADGAVSVTSTTGGSGNYVSETWEDAGANPVANPNAVPGGTYTVTVTDDQGCTGQATIGVNDLSGPTLAIVAQTDASCAGSCDGTASVNATGGAAPYTYNWTPAPGNGQGTNSVTDLCAGNYTVTVTDNNGCVDNMTITIVEPPVLDITITASTDVSINGASDGSATSAATGGTAPYSYEWFNGCPPGTTTGQMGNTAINLASGQYSVVVTDAKGCTDTTCVTINEPNAITSTLVTVDATCNGTCDGSATVTANGGVPGYTYDWYDAATNNPIGQIGVTASNLCAGDYYVIITDANGGTHTSNTVTITEPPSITGTTSVLSNYNGQDISCAGACDGSIEVQAAGGTGGLTFLWDDAGASTTSTVNNVCAGTYNVTVTDANNCTAVFSVTVTEPTPLANVNTSNNASCFGVCDGDATSTPSGGTAGYTFQWDDPSLQTTGTATALCAGTYNVVITDANGCTINDQVTITEPTEILLTTASQGSNCGQTDGSASVAVVQGDPPYTYQWDAAAGNQTTATASNLGFGCYDVTVTDGNGCTKDTTVCVQDLGAPTVTPLTITDVSCNGGCDGFAQVQVTGGNAPYTYQWYDGSGNPVGGVSGTPSINNLCADTYTAEMTDNNGCVATTLVTITEPPALNATISASVDVTCFGDCDGSATVTASGGTAPYIYQWNDPGNQTNAAANNLCPGNYDCIVTDANGCTFIVSVTIAEPAQILLTTTTVDAFCNTGTGSATVNITQGGVGNIAYSWNPSGQGTQTATNLTPGVYTVTVTDQDGCQATANATVGNIPPGIATISASTDALCNGSLDGTATVSMNGGTPGYTYEWYDIGGNTLGQTASTAIDLPAGQYYVQVTDANNCVSLSDTVTINEPDILEVFPSIVAEPSCFGLCDGEVDATPLGGTAPYNFQWNDPLQQTGPNANGICSGTIIVTLTDDHGCVAVDSVILTDPPALVLDSTVTNANCGQPDGQGCVIATGGTAPYTYAWPTGGTNSCEINIAANSYLVTVTDGNGCSEDIVVEVQDLNGPVASIIAQSDALCNASCDGQATVDMVGGAGTTFTVQWDANAANQTTPTASNLCAGTYTVTITDDLGCNASTSVTIAEPQPIVFIQNQTDPSCFGYCDGSAWITITGGTTPYNFQWLDGLNNPIGPNNDTLSGICAGNYILNISDANGCAASANFTLTDPPQVTATTTFTDVVCNGDCDGTATATGVVGVAPFSYQWDAAANSQTTATAGNLCPGTYTVTVTDDDGCFTTATATITEPPLLTASIAASGNVNCFGACDGFAQAGQAGGTPGYTYQWDNNAGINQIATNLCANTYTVTVTDLNGCTATATVTITEPQGLGVTSSSTDVTCHNACDGTAQVNISGGTGPFTYQWDDPAFTTTPAVTNLCAGTWTCVITDALGCQITETVVIIQPNELDLIATLNDANCGQSNGSLCVNVIGGVSPFTYQWSDPLTTSTACLNNVPAGCYNITVIDGNGCVKDSLLCINDIAGPTVTGVNSSDVTCFGDMDGMVEFTVTGGTGIPTYELVDANNTQVNTGQLLTTGLNGGCYTLIATDAAGCVGTDFICINEPNQINSAITSSTDVSCFLGCDGQATVSVSGGLPSVNGYVYAWNAGGAPTAATNTNLCAGNYTVVVSDSNNCQTTSSITINEPTQLQLSTSAVTQVSCNGACDGTTTVDAVGATPPYLYTWTPNVSAGPTGGNLCAGNYTVDVVDGNGCPEQITFAITEPQPLALSASTINSTCTQCNGGASLTVTGGTGPYTYNWLNGGNAPNAATNTGMCPGNHTVEVTDANGCFATLLVTITDEPAPQITGFNLVSPTCNGLSNGSAEVIATGGTGAYTYEWDAAAFNQVSNPAVALPAGTYCVTVSDVNNCEVTQCATITEPAPLLPVPDLTTTICYGDSAQLWASGQGGTAPYTPNWVPAGLNGPGPLTVSPLATTDYCFTVTDANGCLSPQGCVTITVLPPLDLQLTASTAICYSDTIDLVATGADGNGGPYNFTWTDDQGNTLNGTQTGNTSTLSVNPTVDTWYYVTLSDGCSLDVIDSVQVSINPTPSLSLTAVDSAGCAPFTAQFVANSDIGVTYMFDFECDGVIDYTGPNSNPTFTYMAAGTYDVCVTVISGDGCDTTITVSQMITVHPLPVAGFSFDPQMTTLLNPTITFTNSSSGGTTYTWDFGDGSGTITGAAGDTIPDGTHGGNTIGSYTDPIHTYTDTGYFDITLIVTNDFGCTDQITYTVYVEGDYILFAPSAFTPDGDGTNDVFLPVGVGISEDDFEMYIYDRWGQIVFQSQSPYNGWDGTDPRRGGNDIKLDVYVWLIRANDHKGDRHEYIGHVTVIR